MNEVLKWALGLLPALITGAVLFYAQRAQKKRDDEEANRAKARRKEMKLTLDLQMATAKLAYASAMAIKRGYPNGEIEEGIDAYKKALEEFQEFERDQLSRI